MSTLKVDTLNTRTGSGNITFSRPIVADISSVTGTLPMARLSGTLPALNGSALTALNATQLTSGTIPIARLGNDVIDSQHYAAASIDNEHLADDAVGVAELSATGTASNTTFLRGDNVWATPSAGTSLSGTTNNTITTVTGANAVQGETNLQFDGNTFSVKGSGATPTYSMTNNGEGIHLRWNDDSGARKSDIVAIGNTPAGATTTLRFWTNANGTDAATEKLRIDGAGHITKPLNPTVLAHVNTNQNNVTGDATSYAVTGAFWTEVKDYNSDFSNGTFTAPVTGVYLIMAVIQQGGVVSSHSASGVSLVSSNRTIRGVYHHAYNYGGSNANSQVTVGSLFDMDAADTCYLNIETESGGKVIDVYANQCWFSATLIG